MVNGLPQRFSKKVQICKKMVTWLCPRLFLRLAGVLFHLTIFLLSLTMDTCITTHNLESILLNLDNTEDIQDELGHMTDKAMKNGRKYVDSGFVHDMMGIILITYTSSRVAVDDKGATAQCCDFCEQ